MKISLKAKLMLLFFILIGISVTSLGVTSYIMAKNALQTTITNQLKEATNLTAEKITMSINNTTNVVSLISSNSYVEQALVNNNDANRSEAYINFAKTISGNKDGIETLMLADTTGKVVASNDSKDPGTNIADRDYFKSALSGSVVLSDVVKSKVTGNLVTVVAQPIKSNGQTVGVLAAAINFEKISAHAAKFKVGKNGYAYMTDKKLIAVYHPKKENILVLDINKIESDTLQKLTPKMMAGEVGEGFYTYNGIYKYAYFMPVGNWVLVLTADYNEYMSPAFNIRNFTIGITLIAIIVALIFAYWISTNNIIKPIKQLEYLMTKAGEGDLTVVSKIKTGDEIEVLGDSFNNMIGHQESMVRAVRGGARELASSAEDIASSIEQISSATEEISASMQDISRETADQEKSVVETSQVLVQLSSLIQLAQNKAIAAKKNSDNTLKTAEKGRLKVEETVQAMDKINTSTIEAEEVMVVLNELSQQVGGIISTINGIAEQTNMLALNAAIEAARAGEHGKGFAVVADEVRKLSEQSNTGATEIGKLVQEMIIQTSKAVQSIKFSATAVKNGVVVAKETDDSFIDIINAVDGIVNNTQEIVGITQEEVANSDMIIKLIDRVASASEVTSRSTQEISAASEEQAATVQTLAAAAEEASALAISLDGQVEKFIVSGGI